MSCLVVVGEAGSWGVSHREDCPLVSASGCLRFSKVLLGPYYPGEEGGGDCHRCLLSQFF